MHTNLNKPDVQQLRSNAVILNVFTVAPPSGEFNVATQSDLPKTLF